MTVSLSNDYITWTIASPSLASWTNITGVKLYINDAVYTVTQGNYTFALSPKDGIYEFILVITSTGNVVTKETACYFVDQSYKCKVVKAVVDNNLSNVAEWYFLLSKAGQCANCTDVKNLFNLLKAEIDDNCGCNS